MKENVHCPLVLVLVGFLSLDSRVRFGVSPPLRASPWMPTRRDRRLAALGGDDPGVPPLHGASSSDVPRPEQCSTCSEASRRSLHIAAVRSRSYLSDSPTLYSELLPALPPPSPRLPLMVFSRSIKLKGLCVTKRLTSSGLMRPSMTRTPATGCSPKSIVGKR